MKKLNLLIISPRYSEPGRFFFFPLGLAYISAYLKNNGFDVTTLNLSHSAGPINELIAESINENDIDLVLTGGMSFHWKGVSEVLAAAKKTKPDVVTIAGGPIVTATPKLAFENMQMDFGVAGEGEETALELVSALCKGAETSGIDGIVYRRETGETAITKARGPINDLDSIPFPDYEAMGFDAWSSLEWTMSAPELSGVFFDIDHGLRLGEIICSRSCPFNCTFCYHPLGKKYRQRSMDNIFSEIDILVQKHGVNVLRIQDELFSMDEDRIIEFAERIKGYGIKWTAQWRVENANSAIIEKVKDSNAIMFGFGIESMSDVVLNSMKKKTTSRQIKDSLSLARDVGVLAGGNIIFGDPAETYEIANESLDWWLSHPQYNINLSFILAVPDAPIYRDAVAKGIIKDELTFLNDKLPLTNLSAMTNWEFWKLRKKVMHYCLTNKRLLLARMLSSKTTSDTFDGEKIQEFTLECPTCGRESTYRHVLLDYPSHFPIFCKQCFSLMRARTNKVFPGYSPLRSYVHYMKAQLWYVYESFFRDIGAVKILYWLYCKVRSSNVS